MAQQIRRLLAPATRLSAGEWSDETASARPAVACPECGEIFELDETYRVMTGGRVSPVWSCPACAFLNFIELEAYGEPYV